MRVISSYFDMYNFKDMIVNHRRTLEYVDLDGATCDETGQTNVMKWCELLEAIRRLRPCAELAIDGPMISLNAVALSMFNASYHRRRQFIPASFAPLEKDLKLGTVELRVVKRMPRDFEGNDKACEHIAIPHTARELTDVYRLYALKLYDNCYGGRR